MRILGDDDGDEDEDDNENEVKQTPIVRPGAKPGYRPGKAEDGNEEPSAPPEPLDLVGGLVDGLGQTVGSLLGGVVNTLGKCNSNEQTSRRNNIGTYYFHVIGDAVQGLNGIGLCIQVNNQTLVGQVLQTLGIKTNITVTVLSSK